MCALPICCLKIQAVRPAGRVALFLYDADTCNQIAGADFLAGIKRHISRAAKSPAAAQHFVPAITQTKIQRQAVSDLVSDLPKQCCVRIDSMRCGVLGRARRGKCYEVRTTRRFGPVVIIKAANDEIEPLVEQDRNRTRLTSRNKCAYSMPSSACKKK